MDKSIQNFKPAINLGGRPMLWKNPEDLEIEIKDFFETYPVSFWGMASLANHLNTTKDVLYDYAKKPGFSNCVNKARQIIESKWEHKLSEKADIGAIFALKNYGGWKDRTEIDQNISGNLFLEPIAFNTLQLEKPESSS